MKVAAPYTQQSLIHHCPNCKVSLKQSENLQSWTCQSCSAKYSMTNGILNLLPVDPVVDDYRRIEGERIIFDSKVYAEHPYQAYPLDEYKRVLDKLGLLSSNAGDILSLGCGSGIYEKILRTRGFDVYGVDIAANMLKHCDFPVVIADLLYLPIPDESFSGILSAMVLHHLPKNRQQDALMEMARVLKPEGCAYIVEPIWMLRSYLSHPIAKLFGWQTKMEKPLKREEFVGQLRRVFSCVDVSTINSLEYIGFSPFLRPVHFMLKGIFNIIPFTERDEFVVIKVRK